MEYVILFCEPFLLPVNITAFDAIYGTLTFSSISAKPDLYVKLENVTSYFPLSPFIDVPFSYDEGNDGILYSFWLYTSIFALAIEALVSLAVAVKLTFTAVGISIPLIPLVLSTGKYTNTPTGMFDSSVETFFNAPA